VFKPPKCPANNSPQCQETAGNNLLQDSFDPETRKRSFQNYCVFHV